MNPIECNGYPVNPEELEGSDEILAVLPDDRIVMICGHDRIRVGSGYGCGASDVTENWYWLDAPVVQAPLGLYQRMIEFPAAVETEVNARKSERRGWIRFKKLVYVVGYQALTDVVNDGWSAVFNRARW